MKVFIDTNILLDIYHLSGPDLEELRKLRKMVEKGEVDLLVSSQVVDEFWRNRERVIADALKIFHESKAIAKIPNIIRIYPEAKELKATVDKVNQIIKFLSAKAESDVRNDALKADEILQELFSSITIGKITNDIYARASRRSSVGNPPGKKDSLGDAINWEWLLEQKIEFWDDELIIISGDGDYESELTKGKLREYLLREWMNKNPDCKLKLERSLAAFLLQRFPEIQLAEEVEKAAVIERLEQSNNFATTHGVLATLNKYDDFKEPEVIRILKAYIENNQILWILGDEDVKAFAKKIISFAKSCTAKEAAQPLKKMVDDLDLQDDEIPF